MEQSQLIAYGLLSLLVYYAVLYFAIYNATEKQRKNSETQTKLLAQIARKAGVTEEEIGNCYK